MTDAQFEEKVRETMELLFSIVIHRDKVSIVRSLEHSFLSLSAVASVATGKARFPVNLI